MENREFRSELQEMWLGRFSKSHRVEKPEVKIVTSSDMIRLIGHYAAGCTIVMGVVVLALMVAP